MVPGFYTLTTLISLVYQSYFNCPVPILGSLGLLLLYSHDLVLIVLILIFDLG